MLRLVSLSATNFGCIQKVKIDFGPKLNVLYGPNDLGKSSLANAIRAALLLQFTSSERDTFVPWGTDMSPNVELVIHTGPESFWRISKVFGIGAQGSARLDFSPDGSEWSEEVTGRGVDGRIRELLRWGIPAPGRGAPKGLPTTFLTESLLAHQGQVTTIFTRDLSGDPDSKQSQRLLGDALDALAQDPKFRAALEAAQAHIDLAFVKSDGAKPSTRQKSPFRTVKDLMEVARRAVQERQQKANESRDALQKRSEYLALRHEHEQALHDRQLALQEIASRFAAGQAHADLSARLQAAEQEIERIQRTHTDVADARATLTTKQQTLATQKTALAGLEGQVAQATTTLSDAKEALRRLQTAEGENERALRHQELQNQHAKAQRLVEQAQDRVRAAEQARDRDGKSRAAAQRVEALIAEQAGLTTQRETLQQQERDAQQALDDAHQLQQWLTWRAASDAAATARSRVQDADALRSKATGELAKAATLEAQLAERPLPDRTVHGVLRTLRRDLDVAEGALALGLAVTVEPLQGFTLRSAADGAAGQATEVSSPLELTAERELALELGDLAKLTIRAGRTEALEQARQLRQRWQKDGEPVLAAAGVSSLGGLQALLDEADERQREAQQARAQAIAFEAQITALGDTTAALQAAQQRLTAAEAELSEPLRHQLADAVAALGSRPESALQDRLKQAQSTLDRVRRDLQALAERAAGHTSALEGARERASEAQAELSKALEAFPQGWEQGLASAQQDGKAAQAARETSAQQLARVEQEAAAEVAEAERGVEDSQRALDTLTQERAVLAKSCEALSDDVNRLAGELKVREEHAAKLDLAAAQHAAQSLREELAQHPAPHPPATEDQVQQAQAAVKQAESDLRTTEGELRRWSGKVEDAGGATVEEALQEAQAQLEAAEEREAEVNLDQHAWVLLRDTLREAEQTQGSHLGNLLSAPVTQRFGSLVGARYGEVSLGPHLRAQGITALNAQRSIDLLSIGTQEQLSTLLRLVIAEQLQSVVLLDDQLVQSDAQRLSWFRDALRETSKTTQVVILTCRPEDYLVPQELVPPSRSTSDRDGIHAVALDRAMTSLARP